MEKDLTKISIVIPAEVYQRLISWIASKPYQEVWQPLEDLKQNAYELDNSSLPARLPTPLPAEPVAEPVAENTENIAEQAVQIS